MTGDGDPRRKRVCVGAVAGAYGVRGEARLKPFTADPGAIASYGALETEDGSRHFTATVTRSLKGGVAARLSGVSSREEAEALKGVRLYVDRGQLPEPQDDEYYHADLIGLSVVGLSNEIYGVVKAVHDFGAGDVLEIAPPAASTGGLGKGERSTVTRSTGAQATTVMVPFTREVVPHVDLAAGVVVADPPDGVFVSPEDQETPHSAPPTEIS